MKENVKTVGPHSHPDEINHQYFVGLISAEERTKFILMSQARAHLRDVVKITGKAYDNMLQEIESIKPPSLNDAINGMRAPRRK